MPQINEFIKEFLSSTFNSDAKSKAAHENWEKVRFKAVRKALTCLHTAWHTTCMRHTTLQLQLLRFTAAAARCLLLAVWGEAGAALASC